MFLLVCKMQNNLFSCESAGSKASGLVCVCDCVWDEAVAIMRKRRRDIIGDIIIISAMYIGSSVLGSKKLLLIFIHYNRANYTLYIPCISINITLSEPVSIGRVLPII